MREKSTTAGTTLFASELNGFEGMYRSMKLKSGRGSTRLVLKNEAFWTDGKRQRDQERERQRQEPQAADHGRGSQAQRLQLGRPERPQARDDRDGDVGQDHHLEQLDEAVRCPLQRRGLLAEEQPGEDAEREPDEDLARERHEGVWT